MTDYVQGDGPAVYTTSCSGGVSANYAFVYVDGTFTVGKATLTVTASTPANGVYGDAVPAVTAGYSGFVLGEGPADLDTAPSCVTDYVQGDGPAVYTTSCSGGVSANYAFVYVDGTFTVGKATLTVTASTPANGVYGDAVPAVTAGYSGFVLGEGPADLDTAPSCVTDYVQGDGPAVYTTSCSGGVSANYAFVYVDGTFTVGKATSSTVVTCPVSVPFTGAAQTPCSVSVTGAGGLSLAPAASYLNNVGPGTATASYSYVGDANHTGSSDSKTFLITVVGATLKVTKIASDATVNVGDPFSYTITVTNTSASSSAAFTVSDPLPPEVTFASVGGPDASDCSQVNGTVTCSRSVGLAAGASVTWTINVGAFMSGAPLNVATVTPSGPDTIDDSNPSGNAALVSIVPGDMTTDVATGDPDWQNQIDGVDALFTEDRQQHRRYTLKATNPGTLVTAVHWKTRAGIDIHVKEADARTSSATACLSRTPTAARRRAS